MEQYWLGEWLPEPTPLITPPCSQIRNTSLEPPDSICSQCNAVEFFDYTTHIQDKTVACILIEPRQPKEQFMTTTPLMTPPSHHNPTTNFAQPQNMLHPADSNPCLNTDSSKPSDILSQSAHIATNCCNIRTINQPQYTTDTLNNPVPYKLHTTHTLCRIDSTDMPTTGSNMAYLQQSALVQSWAAALNWLDQLSSAHDQYINMMARHNKYRLTTLQQLVHEMKGLLKKIYHCKASPNSRWP